MPDPVDPCPWPTHDFTGVCVTDFNLLFGQHGSCFWTFAWSMRAEYLLPPAMTLAAVVLLALYWRAVLRRQHAGALFFGGWCFLLCLAAHVTAQTLGWQP